MYKVYIMYMPTYTVKEFRDNMREALDAATKGYVFIKRHDKTFRVSLDTVDIKVGPLPYKVDTRGTDKPSKKVASISLSSARLSQGLCKIHQIPLDSRGRCLQKGCRYA